MCVNRDMRLVPMVAMVALAVTACQADSSSDTTTESQSQDAANQGGLSADEFARAIEASEQVQSTITGTFVGAVAKAVDEPDPDLDPGCADERLIRVRLVWMADANFVHGDGPGAPPDGPRKANLVSISAATGEVCSQGAAYRHVGALADEVLLYGSRP